MNESSFRSEMMRMASANGIFLTKAGQLADLMREDVMQSADFINIFPGTNKQELLVVTTRAVHSLQMGLLLSKLLWTVRLDEIESVEPCRRTFRGYVLDELEVRAQSRTFTFQFGFNSPEYITETQREIAAHNAHIAAEEISATLQRVKQRISTEVRRAPRPAITIPGWRWSTARNVWLCDEHLKADCSKCGQPIMAPDASSDNRPTEHDQLIAPATTPIGTHVNRDSSPRSPDEVLPADAKEAVLPKLLTIQHFALTNPRGHAQGDIPALLRGLADTIEELGSVDLQDLTFRTEITDDGPRYHATVYLHVKGEE